MVTLFWFLFWAGILMAVFAIGALIDDWIMQPWLKRRDERQRAEFGLSCRPQSYYDAQRQLNRSWRDFVDNARISARPKIRASEHGDNVTDICHRLRVPPPSKL